MPQSKNLHTYNFRDVVALVGGIALTGFGEDDGITISPASEVAELIVGSDGEKTRVLHNDDSVAVTFALAQSSAANDLLSAQLRSSRRGGTFALAIKDNRGRSLLFSKECFVAERPEVVFDSGLNTREWIVIAPFPEEWIGGADTASGLPGLPSLPGVTLPFG